MIHFFCWPKIACSANAICWSIGEQESPNERGLGSQDEGSLAVSILRGRLKDARIGGSQQGNWIPYKLQRMIKLRKKYFHLNPLHDFEATMSKLNDVTLEERKLASFMDIQECYVESAIN